MKTRGLLRDLPLAPAIDDPWNAAADDSLLEEAVTFCALFARHDQLLGIEPEDWTASALSRFQIVRGRFSTALVRNDLVANFLSLAQITHARALNRANMNEYIRAAPSGRMKPKPLVALNHFTVPVAIFVPSKEAGEPITATDICKARPARAPAGAGMFPVSR